MNTLSFKQELQDFWWFLRQPRLAPRFAQQDLGHGWVTDWTNGLGVKRLLQWVAFLWLINITVFGPLAAMVATSAGAEHKLDFGRIPWKQAILWAPLIEEMVFRYVLRRPSQFFWLIPVTLWCLLSGPQTVTVAVALTVVVLLIWRPAAAGSQPALWRQIGLGAQWPWHWYRWYCRHFAWFFYGSTVLFAALHLYNFKFDQIELYTLPLLILPQFVTGLVLAWLRVRRGIGASIILHALFNAGPLLLIMAIMRLLPDLAH